MGANEKHEAAMHGGEHDFGSADPISANRVRFMSESELDRFIANVRAEAKAEALEDMGNVLEADIPGHTHENGQIIAGRNIIRIIRARANQYKEAPSA